jgi:hypothetical protein
LAAFLLFTGEKAVRDVTRDDLKSCREVLDQLPDRFESRFKTKDMRTAIEKNGQRKNPQASIGPTTVDLKWLGPVNHLFQWLVLEEKVEKNPVDGIRSKQDAGDAADTKRLPFKPDQISKLFAITSTDLPKTALYWLPLLLLTTDARPNELAQLQTDDLHLSFNGQPHLNLLCLLDDDDEAANPTEKTEVENDPRRVKTAAGRRMIPLHSILIKAGFIQLVEGGATTAKPSSCFVNCTQTNMASGVRPLPNASVRHQLFLRIRPISRIRRWVERPTSPTGRWRDRRQGHANRAALTITQNIPR